MGKGTKYEEIRDILQKLPLELRQIVEEVTLDMSNSMNLINIAAFPNATLVTDRFHVQKLISEAVQEIRIDNRRKVIKEENENWKQAKKEKKSYCSVTYKNGDSRKQLLARRDIYYSNRNPNGDRVKRKEHIFYLQNIQYSKKHMIYQCTLDRVMKIQKKLLLQKKNLMPGMQRLN